MSKFRFVVYEQFEGIEPLTHILSFREISIRIINLSDLEILDAAAVVLEIADEGLEGTEQARTGPCSGRELIHFSDQLNQRMRSLPDRSLGPRV